MLLYADDDDDEMRVCGEKKKLLMERKGRFYFLTIHFVISTRFMIINVLRELKVACNL